MFERVLVPLDGSRLSEAVLPIAKALARDLDSVLVLAHAVEEDPPEQVHGDRHLTSSRAAETYLREQLELCAEEGLRAEAHVAPPQDLDVAEVIVKLATELDVDLVVMCAHGRQTLRDRVLGPIAQHTLQGGGPPVMLRTAGSSADETVAIRHILLGVDFRHDLTEAVDAATTLAAGFGASLTLVHAVDAGSTGLPARLLPNTSFELSPRARSQAEQRLGQLAEDLGAHGIEVDTVVSTKDPDDAILDTARARHSNLIILVSHGRSGVTAWYERSVGQRLIQEPDLNLLLLRQAQAHVET